MMRTPGRVATCCLPLLFAAFCASAQNLEAFKNRLSQPVGDARVTVIEHDGTSEVVRRHARSSIRISGYRIGVFFDSGSEARAKAFAAAESFRAAFPGIPVQTVYDPPSYNVTAGYCATIEEAVVLLGRVQARFPNAFLKQAELTVSDLVR